jgi:hypothetical protein
MSCLATCTAIGLPGDLHREGASPVGKLSCRYDLSDESPRRGGPGVDRKAREDQLLGAGRTCNRHKTTRGPPPGNRGDPDLRSGERRVIGGDPKVAGERQLQPAPEREAVDGGDRGLAKRLEVVEDTLPRRDPAPPHVDRRELGPGGDVRAGAEPSPAPVTTRTRIASEASTSERIASKSASIAGRSRSASRRGSA